MSTNSIFNATVCIIGIAILLIHIVNILIKRERRKDENTLLNFFILTIIHFIINIPPRGVGVFMDRNEIKHLLEIAKGQLNGITKMLDDGAYCIDISNQLLASIALLKKANANLLDQHLKHCVLNAQSKEEREEKLEEISKIISKVI